MDKAPGVLIASERAPRVLRPVPRLRLLIEWEPRHRVFFGNLADLLLSRSLPPITLTSKPARFWSDVFVPTRVPLASFAEALLWQALIVILFVWGQSRVWNTVKLFPQPDATRKPIVYYPTPSFRASESRAPKPRPRVKRAPHQAAAARRPALPVAPEQKPKLVTPPDIKQATAMPNLPQPHAVAPMVPFSSTASARRSALPGTSGVVAPAPQVDQAAARRMGIPQASAVAPAPDLSSTADGRGTKTPNAGSVRVVPPPPSVQNNSNGAGAGRLSGLPGARPNVVPPPPSVQSGGDARLVATPGAGSLVVPPPPSVQGAGSGRLSSLNGTRANVVPPAPSVQGGGGGARVGAMPGPGPQVVPPPPSVQSAAGAGRTNGLATGSQVVPPPPSVQSAEGAGRVNGLATGSQVVPPPPSVQSEGSPGGSRLASLSGAGSDVLPPSSRAGNSGASGTGKLLEPMDPLPGDGASSTTAANNDDKATIEELPLGLLGVVFAAPGTSFFSNFEVFVAKRKVKDQLQLIKLVYEFLPYQRRLSEYNLSNIPARVIKLRVIPDPSCDESLGQMIHSHADPDDPATQDPKLPAALRATDMNAVLPCHRTSAADFQKAMAQGR